MLGWLRNLFGGSKVATAERQRDLAMQHAQRIKAKYDNANLEGPNQRHFSEADCLSAAAANSPDVRSKLRRFARYETANNSYAKGIILTLANEIIGRGGRLQSRIPQNREANRQLERVFFDWTQATGLAEKLHTFVQAAAADGEACATAITNPRTPHQVKLDISAFECDRLTAPYFTSLNALTQQSDGIAFDRLGNPLSYSVSRQHPGDSVYSPAAGWDMYPASQFLHWFRVDRPGQVRGVPWITPCLGLFAQLRRWTLATLQASETAACLTAILSTKGSPNTTAQADPWDEIDIRLGTMMTIPEGWGLDPFDAKQPISTYHSFKNEILKEIARCLNMPFNVVTGDSSLYNYASGRLDYQNWHRMLRVLRAQFERRILERIFGWFIAEASLIPGLLPAVDLANIPHGWFWDGVQHVDPIKDGTGDQLALANNTDTLANLCAAQGLDWEEVLEQRSEEVKRMRELGLDIYLPDFAMLVQKDIAESNDTQQRQAQGNYFRNLIGGRN